MQRNGRQEAHLRKGIRKGIARIGQVYGIGKRRLITRTGGKM